MYFVSSPLINNGNKERERERERDREKYLLHMKSVSLLGSPDFLLMHCHNCVLKTGHTSCMYVYIVAHACNNYGRQLIDMVLLYFTVQVLACMCYTSLGPCPWTSIHTSNLQSPQTNLVYVLQ